MKSLCKIFLLFIASSILFIRCVTKAYPDNMFMIDSDMRIFFNSVTAKDTLNFQSENQKEKVFVITKIDSIIRNSKGGFMSERPYKLLQFKFREIGTDTVVLERENEVFINKYSENNGNTICIKFNNLYYWNDSILPVVRRDTLHIIGTEVTDYYVFENSVGLTNADDVKTLYATKETGFIAFRTKSGEVWVRKGVRR